MVEYIQLKFVSMGAANKADAAQKLGGGWAASGRLKVKEEGLKGYPFRPLCILWGQLKLARWLLRSGHVTRKRRANCEMAVLMAKRGVTCWRLSPKIGTAKKREL